MRFTFSSLCATGKMLSTGKDCIEKTPARLPFGDIAMFCHRRMGQNFRFHHIFVWHVIDERGVYLGFAAQRHNLLLICRKIKSQDGFVL